MNILKTIGKIFAGIFVLLGLTIFIMSSFGGYAINNINILEQDFTNNLGINMDDIERYCEDNQEDANCKNNILLTVKKETDEFSYYGNMMKVFGFIFFILGFLLFAWCKGWLLGLRSTCLISSIGIVFSYVYYKYIITSTLTSFLSKEIMNIVGNWLTVTLNQTLNLTLILGVIFLILTVWLYIKTKKKIKEE